ncbi:MAG: OmpA family protein [Deltaproteobacteria bacterium]|nr:OmpA family protein [Deltaproteobacteria bacterium]
MRPRAQTLALWTSVSLALGGMVGCEASSSLRGRLSAVGSTLDQAERNGAMRCAPRELALGRAETRFSGMELDEGDLTRAQQHFDQALPNANAALRLSPPDRCLPHADAPPPPPPPPQPGDRDGDGLLDPVDQCPDQPENFNAFRDEDGCPDDPDTDGDGVPDSADRCVVEPEDRDGYQDEDGCPEPDNDADGVLDGADRCINEPEDRDGFQDEDGCPDPDNDQDTVLDVADNCPMEAGPPDNSGCPPVFQHIQVTSHGVRFHVEFDNNRATLRPSATETLDEVVRFLAIGRNAPLRYEVGGHTDSRGSVRRNETLSRNRAEAVRVYLISHNIDASRLTSRGYGPRIPIESNRTEEGRQSNRRVELNEIDANGNIVR